MAILQKPNKIFYTILCWWYCKLKFAYLWFVCLTTTHTHVLKLTKLYEVTLKILRQVCKEEQVVMNKLTVEQGPVECNHHDLLH